MVLETVAMDTLAMAATARISGVLSTVCAFLFLPRANPKVEMKKTVTTSSPNPAILQLVAERAFDPTAEGMRQS